MIKRPGIILLVLMAFTIIISCGNEGKDPEKDTVIKTANIDSLALDFVKLALQLGRYDKNYIDSYFGPENLRKQAEADSLPLNEIILAADSLGHCFDELDTTGFNDIRHMRARHLRKLIESLKARAEIVNGADYSFDDQSKALYDAVSTTFQENYYNKILAQLDSIVPGEGPLRERFIDFRKQFIVPSEKLDTVFRLAINEGRRRTLEHLQLIPGENFQVEYVTNKPWGAYNWYKGNGYSLIQVNTDLPIYIDRIITLAMHEGYPGHHVYHQLIEKYFAKDSNWVEFTVYALFSPQALLSEGMANFGIEVAMPGRDRINFEKNVLFPAAGLDTTNADLYFEILDLLDKLSYAGNDAARKYLDGYISRDEAIDMLMKYNLKSRDHAAKNVDFYDTYGAYIINYNYGCDLIRDYVDRNGGTVKNPEKRWELFKEIIEKPYLPSDLKK